MYYSPRGNQRICGYSPTMRFVEEARVYGDSSGLRSLLEELSTRLRELPATVLPESTKARFLTVVLALRSSADLERQDVVAVEQATVDAKLAMERAQSAAGDPVAAKLLVNLLDRVADQVAMLLTVPMTPAKATQREDFAGGEPRDGAPQLMKVSAAYGEDAEREQRSSIVFSIIGLVVLIGTAVAAYWLTRQATRVEQGRIFASMLGPTITCGTCVTVTLVCFARSANHRRASREYIRLQRSLTAVPAYLSSLPPDLQHFMTATMAQSLFPQIPEDNDPSRQATWPESDALLDAIVGKGEQDASSEEV